MTLCILNAEVPPIYTSHFSLLSPPRALATRIHSINKRLEGLLWESDQLKSDHCTLELIVKKFVAKAEMVKMHSICSPTFSNPLAVRQNLTLTRSGQLTIGRSGILLLE